MSGKLTPFEEAVLHCVSRIPRGRVVTCAQVGESACSNVPGALSRLVDKGHAGVPWHRVVYKDRSLLKVKMGDQEKELSKEQVKVQNGHVDQKFYLATFRC